MINYETYLYIFDARFSLKSTYRVNWTLNSKTDAIALLFSLDHKLYASDYDSDSDSVASENQPLEEGIEIWDHRSYIYNRWYMNSHGFYSKSLTKYDT